MLDINRFNAILTLKYNLIPDIRFLWCYFHGKVRDVDPNIPRATWKKPGGRERYLGSSRDQIASLRAESKIYSRGQRETGGTRGYVEVYLGEKLFRNKSPKKNSSAGPPLTRLKKEERKKEKKE